MDLSKELNRLADSGYCPALLFDDDGRWALVFDGFQPVNLFSDAQAMYTTHFVDVDDWKDTIEEAFTYAIEKARVVYNDLES